MHTDTHTDTLGHTQTHSLIPLFLVVKLSTQTCEGGDDTSQQLIPDTTVRKKTLEKVGSQSHLCHSASPGRS